MEWFRHDCNAHDDLKIRKLKRMHGMQAYGVYWELVELMYSKGGTLPGDSILDEVMLMGIEEDDARDMCETFLELGLFRTEEADNHTYVWTSERVNEEIEYLAESRRKKSYAGKKGMASRWGSTDNNVITDDNTVITPPNTPITDDNTIPNHTLPSNIPLSVSKETSSPTGKSVSPSSSKFQKPTLEEVKAYCKERHNSVNAEDFINYYDSVGWIVGKGKHMKDWKASVRTWEKDTKAPAPRKDLSDIGVQKVTKIDWGV